MQIRIRKNTLTLLRTVYDPAIKRGRSVSLGSVPIASRDLPTEIAAKLTPSERDQVLRELEKFHSVREIELEALAAKLLPVSLRRAIRWYNRQKASEELVTLASDSRELWTELLAAMVRAGVGRTRQRTRR